MKDNDLYNFSINNLVDDKPIEPTKSTSFINHIKNQNNIKLLAGSTINYKKRTNLSIDGFYKKSKFMRYIRKIGDTTTLAIMKLFKLIQYNKTKVLNPPTIVKGIPDNYDDNK